MAFTGDLFSFCYGIEKNEESDYLPDRRVCTEENSYCENDCRVLNEGKLRGCPTVVPGLMKYRLVGTTCVHAIPISSFSTRCGRVRTEETGSCVHCVNGLDQNADLYVNRHGVDRLSGARVIYTGCHARRVVLCYTLCKWVGPKRRPV